MGNNRIDDKSAMPQRIILLDVAKYLDNIGIWLSGRD